VPKSLQLQQLRELRLETGQSANQEIGGVTQPVTNSTDVDEILGRPAILKKDGSDSFDFAEAWARFTSSSAASLPAEIVEGLGLLLKMSALRGFPHTRWPSSVMQVVQFATDWAPLALRLAWTPEELFGLDRAAPYTRHDRKGLAFTLSCDKHIVAVTESHAHIKAASGAHLRFYRQAASASAVLAWDLDCGGQFHSGKVLPSDGTAVGSRTPPQSLRPRNLGNGARR
jgi:hypothetical protein